MNTLIVYHSVFGNTQAIAEAIAEAMQQKGAVRLTRVDRFSAAELEGIALMIMGCPTHRHSVPQAVRTMLEGMSRGALRGVGVAAFDTRYRKARWLTGSAAHKVARNLRKFGGRQVVGPESFFVAGREGPLEEGEIERAKEWAELILGQLEA
jgi:flavodoxin